MARRFRCKPKSRAYRSCSFGAVSAEPMDLWARSGIGTRWLVVVEDAGRGTHGHQGEEPFQPFAPNKRQLSSHGMETFFRLC